MAVMEFFEKNPNDDFGIDIDEWRKSISSGTSHEILDRIAADLPNKPRVWMGGELTLHDMYEDLSEKELDYVISKYKGLIKKVVDN